MITFNFRLRLRTVQPVSVPACVRASVFSAALVWIQLYACSTQATERRAGFSFVFVFTVLLSEHLFCQSDHWLCPAVSPSVVAAVHVHSTHEDRNVAHIKDQCQLFDKKRPNGCMGTYRQRITMHTSTLSYIVFVYSSVTDQWSWLSEAAKWMRSVCKFIENSGLLQKHGL